MPKKYHITTKATPLELEYISKFKIVRGENCINCGKCTKVCIYEVHKRSKDDPRKMAEPNTKLCRNCFRCIQECPRGALSKSIDKEFASIGGTYWKPDMLISLWKQAEDGAVPVSGAGYRGPFTGTGFDSMWTDMSEIVRPTRDGIHGREYINTSVDLGRKLDHLTFDFSGRLTVKPPAVIDVPLPVLFDMPVDNLSPNVKLAIVAAANQIGTFIIMPVSEISAEIDDYKDNIIPLLSAGEIDKYPDLIKKSRLISLEFEERLFNDLSGLKEKVKAVSNALIIIRVPAVKNIEEIVDKLACAGADIIHIVGDYRGREVNGRQPSERLLKDIIRSVHMKLLESRIRDEVTIIASGGIATAEFVPKAMLCGADLTAVDLSLLVALGVKLYEEPEKMLVFPEGLAQIPVPIITQRIVNLMGAWHSQLLEVMGAMGIREARRLRGESGRAIFFEEIDRDTFGKLFKKDAVNL